ncbi:MAG: glutamine--fructose-6-phosphate aminotransferase [Candidatus Lambdaproteobacteria bacterium RIFOXYD1_FULL_56_27]|uniref:Glutamine--fructose-6-phosphate aminotransferase [isomerizing] n=1 Tax=Candidatus Lambdaproteobacteria bacterium RIFOXYD2_FULL_56_26 TaxID=1817773 RepID=A0A1F6GRG2_9PROT|nr:MAG: glutamine--fructose-6-phosphate aminotransferase [Candidatus Lambdaproteobacteria bacterium RIFOXYC1_FULL_56_13]OGH00638.1 MAG: glutamine--fructose-6-phosphate aminotransferase [Candidatus Lambdaproteobacteria bacterium RIFOXYD2_FULL_56_26]OGH07804.1 MAG: glutamine--fructose-6-phosphate aminotransferase [Candidatus Lambdaproteobacteria bacterium RIFOXYD1_FULL_56_27]
MCGISAIASHRPVAGSLLQCLKNLEYRGYDSCGMAIFDQGKIELRKNVGHVAKVDEVEQFHEMQGQIGIAHTRWATHGGVTQANSHPHASNDGTFVVVHNGIFSNYQALRNELKSKGFVFHSDTDTEVLANLLQDLYVGIGDVEKTFVAAVKRLEGSYAVAVLTPYLPNQILGAKKDSPLVLGLGDGENYLTSDINAYISQTRDTVLLGDLEYVIVSKENYQVKSLVTGETLHKEVIQVQWDKETAKMGGYSHFMLKEIFDQPQTVNNALAIDDTQIQAVAERFLSKTHNFACGVGTTFYVAMVTSYLFKRYAGLYVPAVSSDEFPTLLPLSADQHTLFFSQSGETYDTRMAVRAAQNAGGATSAVVNVVGSSISQMVDQCIFQGSGPEICVVSTKAAFSQVVIGWRIAMRVGRLNGTLPAAEEQRILGVLASFSDLLERTLNEESGFIRQLAKKTSHIHNWLFMGKDIYYPVALESALKMKEVTYLHAEGLPAGFLKHGTLAMVDEKLYSLFFLPSPEEGELYRSTLAAIEEVKARNGVVVSFATEDNHEAREKMDYCIQLPKLPKELNPLMQLVLAQLFSYYSALHLGLNIDKPRNLAKSVTVG